MSAEDNVKIEIKGMWMSHVLGQMAEVAQARGKAVTPSAEDEKRINGKLDLLLEKLADLLSRVDMLDPPEDVKSDDQWIKGRGGLRAQKVKEVGQVDPYDNARIRKEVKRTTPRDVTDPPFPAGDEGIEDLRKAIQEGHQVALPNEGLEGLIEKFAEQDDRMEALGREIEELARRIAETQRNMGQQIQRKISSVIESFDEARRMEKVKKCEHVAVPFEFVTYEYEDGNRKVLRGAAYDLFSWVADTTKENPTFAYFFGGQRIEHRLCGRLCGKCGQVFVIADGEVVK